MESYSKFQAIFFIAILGLASGMIILGHYDSQKDALKEEKKDFLNTVKLISTNFSIVITSNVTWYGEINCESIFGINGTNNQTYNRTDLRNYCRILIYMVNSSGYITVNIFAEQRLAYTESTNKSYGYVYISYIDHAKFDLDFFLGNIFFYYWS